MGTSLNVLRMSPVCWVSVPASYSAAFFRRWRAYLQTRPLLTVQQAFLNLMLLFFLNVTRYLVLFRETVKYELHIVNKVSIRLRLIVVCYFKLKHEVHSHP